MGYDETLRDFKHLVHKSEQGMVEEIGKVAIDHVDIDIKRPWEAYNKALFIRSFPHLEEVTLVVPPKKKQERGRFNEWLQDVVREGNLEFVQPNMDPERLLMFWAGFRRSFVSEERLLEHTCRVIGKEYTAFVLPRVRIMFKVSRATVV